MFLCKECAEDFVITQLSYLMGRTTSHGPCEICKEIKNCYDISPKHYQRKKCKYCGTSKALIRDKKGGLVCSICAKKSEKKPRKRCIYCKSINTREDTMGFWVCLSCGLVWKFVKPPTKEAESFRKKILKEHELNG